MTKIKIVYLFVYIINSIANVKAAWVCPDGNEWNPEPALKSKGLKTFLSGCSCGLALPTAYFEACCKIMYF